MATHAPSPSHPITVALSASGVTITRVPRCVVPSRTPRGTDHTVTEHERQLRCSCAAGQYGTWCWHRDWVKDGRASKPRIGVMPVAATVKPTTTARAGRSVGDTSVGERFGLADLHPQTVAR